MRTLHIVDDTEADREIIARIVKESWEQGEEPAQVPELRDWEFIWDLMEGDELQAGDVIIADLYSDDYWKLAPAPKPERRQPRPKDPTNFYNATVDVIVRFLAKAPEREGDLFVMTYIPHYIERNLRVPVAAEKLRKVLKSQPFTVFEKERRFGDEECVWKAVRAANEVLGR